MNYNEKLAYFAGLLDGEGNIQVQKLKTQYTARITIANTDKEMIDWLKNNFEGYTYVQKRGHRNPKWKTCYFWIRIISGKAEQFIKDLIPYSITKKERLNMLLEFLSTKSTNGISITEEVVKQRESIISKLRLLNKRGI